MKLFKKLTVSTLTLLISSGAFAHNGVDHSKTTAQKTCPVMGGKINKNLSVEANGQKIYVCCKGCISKVKNDPKKDIEVLEKRGETVETVKLKVQETCPVMGRKINKDLFVEVDGQKIYVCCKGCISNVKNDPKKYIEVLKTRGEGVEKVQTQCPVMNKPINKSLYVDVNGKRIYVCCKGCISRVKNNPTKYVDILEDKGITIENSPNN